ncbi:hypothetical protein PGTUg99_017378 [Puccinia graminis f. sp. tritici]|uniref:Uncharacterized protein n=1 Tax=Puccinia graminis f. sp. tritici TaxID=56615 RepID=A0A5B0RUN4_PUCGR|nr:hypothetical protein PGTUg99_017378 [Puccinia graminis f. sp. tritici]
MQFGPPEVRATLERHHKRRQINADDAGGEALLNMVADVQESIRLNSGGNGSEYPSFVNPEDPSMEMRVLYKEIWDWAKAILAEEDGVDLTHPPQGPKYPKFQWTKRRGSWKSISEVEVMPTSNEFVPLTSTYDPRQEDGFCIHSPTPFDPTTKTDQLDRLPTPLDLMTPAPVSHHVGSFATVAKNRLYPPFLGQGPPTSVNPAAGQTLSCPVSSTPAWIPQPAVVMNTSPIPVASDNPIIPCAAANQHSCPPISPSMEVVTMDQYLEIARIKPGNDLTRGRLMMLGITHWSFFRSTSFEALVGYGFPPGTAYLLSEGVARLKDHFNWVI